MLHHSEMCLIMASLVLWFDVPGTEFQWISTAFDILHTKHWAENVASWSYKPFQIISDNSVDYRIKSINPVACDRARRLVSDPSILG